MRPNASWLGQVNASRRQCVAIQPVAPVPTDISPGTMRSGTSVSARARLLRGGRNMVKPPIATDHRMLPLCVPPIHLRSRLRADSTRSRSSSRDSDFIIPLPLKVAVRERSHIQSAGRHARRVVAYGGSPRSHIQMLISDGATTDGDSAETAASDVDVYLLPFAERSPGRR